MHEINIILSNQLTNNLISLINNKLLYPIDITLNDINYIKTLNDSFENRAINKLVKLINRTKFEYYNYI